MEDRERHTAGMAVRRKVLGDAHVDRSIAQTDELTAEFQDLITRYVWGEIWTRPGLDVRTRRILVFGTLIALGRWDEVRLHGRAALQSGDLDAADLKEIILQQTMYCGVPAGRTAFEALGELLAELEKTPPGTPRKGA